MKLFWTVGRTGEESSMEGAPAKTTIFSWKGGWFQREAEKYILFQSLEFSLQLYPCWRHETDELFIYWIEGVVNKSCFGGAIRPIAAQVSVNEGKHRYIQQQCPQVLQCFWVESSYRWKGEERGIVDYDQTEWVELAKAVICCFCVHVLTPSQAIQCVWKG